MNWENTIQNAENYVREVLNAEASGHDWYHIQRVTKVARRIAKQEGAEVHVVHLAALLHDIGDAKLHGGDEGRGKEVVIKWLANQGVKNSVIERLMNTIEQASFSFSLTPEFDPKQLSLETKILSDADKLDAIGAIGIARTFAYGGKKGHAMHDPRLPVRTNLDKSAYRDSSKSTTINHFYEKLLRLRDQLYTESAKAIAKERHAFMEAFLEQFYREWNSE